jgi:predicted dehydrogenase
MANRPSGSRDLLLENDRSTSTIRWGILGSGMVAQAFAEDLPLVPGAVLVAVASRRLEMAHAFARRFQINRVHEGAKDLADDENVDVVYVASPHTRHVEHCLACLRTGKAVLCEKPLATSASGAGTVAEEARRNHRFCMEAMWMRFHPLILEIRAAIRSGELGKIRLLSAEFGYPTQFDPENRFFNRELGGGALLDRGVYLLSLADFLLGPPEEVSGKATIGPTGVDDQSSLLLSYSTGALATLTASLRSRLRNDAVIFGEKGTICIHDPFYSPHRMSRTWCQERTGKTPPSDVTPLGWKKRLRRHPLICRGFETIVRPAVRAIRGGGEETRLNFPPGDGYQFEAAEVMRCLRSGQLESPLMPLSESVSILKTADTLRTSWGLRYPDEPEISLTAPAE